MVKAYEKLWQSKKWNKAPFIGKTLEQARRQFVETRSVKKGERKKVLAERIVGQLAFDATNLANAKLSGEAASPANAFAYSVCVTGTPSSFNISLLTPSKKDSPFGSSP